MWEFLTATEGPWWGEAAIAGGFLIIGALISLITAAAVEFGKSRRELARRFDADIREASAAFLAKAEAFWEADTKCQRMLTLPLGTGSEADKRRQTLAELRRASHDAGKDVSKTLQPLSFVAPDPLMAAARRHYEAIREVGMIESGVTEEDIKRYSDTRQHVVDQVRLTIKLPASKLNKKPWHRRLGDRLK